jgi:hypothetical protein
MEYLTIIRAARRIAFTAFLVNIVIVSICWGFIWTNLMQHFMWTMPGFTLVEANNYIMWMIGILHMLAIAGFLIPTIALSLEIVCEKRRLIREEREWQAMRAELFGDDTCGVCYSEPAPKSKPAAKKKPVKKKNK